MTHPCGPIPGQGPANATLLQTVSLMAQRVSTVCEIMEWEGTLMGSKIARALAIASTTKHPLVGLQRDSHVSWAEL